MVLNHDTWHNKNLQHGIYIWSTFLKANYFMTCGTSNPNLLFNILNQLNKFEPFNLKSIRCQHVASM
jgi:hypothetical protein